ncbi:MAG: hypothetical protein ACTS8U_04085 [Arsenophonus sp. ET-DL9-MAG3]
MIIDNSIKISRQVSEVLDIKDSISEFYNLEISSLRLKCFRLLLMLLVFFFDK